MWRDFTCETQDKPHGSFLQLIICLTLTVALLLAFAPLSLRCSFGPRSFVHGHGPVVVRMFVLMTFKQFLISSAGAEVVSKRHVFR